MIARSRAPHCRVEEIPDYVSGHLAPQRAAAWDRHLIACVCCQHAVADERRLQAMLASGAPSMPGSLHAQLVALASSMTGPAMAQTGERAPREPAPLQMVPPSAPPVHRTSLRTAALATAAASATAAVAWTLTLAGPGAMTATVTTRSGSGTAPSASPIPAWGALRVQPASFCSAATPSPSATHLTSIRGLVPCRAESRP
ncbi:hypothetical protein BCF74_10731 [Knoellia remsis]|uniref:Uncharacterized protein n=1 Tax=Knoellia remsis TaxID=407159 RepID=A0A2T0UQP1_9MICO|nr:hypothetical protein [Knoellia remsis]PRY60245.1 hypothetical protein BCF74_10731 [Knoellia remsis]